MSTKATPIWNSLWLVLAAGLSIGGVAAFIWLFALHFNIYYFILSPVIIPLYQAPAFLAFRIWKKKKAGETAEAAPGINQVGRDPREAGKPAGSKETGESARDE